jgi:hypothetical protein
MYITFAFVCITYTIALISAYIKRIGFILLFFSLVYAAYTTIRAKEQKNKVQSRVFFLNKTFLN